MQYLLISSITSKGRNSWFMLKSGVIVQVYDKTNNTLKCNCYFRHYFIHELFFESLCKSSLDGIVKILYLSKPHQQDISKEDLSRKDTLLIRLLHEFYVYSFYFTNYFYSFCCLLILKYIRVYMTDRHYLIISLLFIETYFALSLGFFIQTF